ncbi:MAG: CDP-alcohol phosphatidyltransferase family protein [Candidatus Marinimicrobia bacterium]|nr:CDP-alcohol phosphatidyltransferase family protein [Candidatus Neomarinimicrobiota bacterium]
MLWLKNFLDKMMNVPSVKELKKICRKKVEIVWYAKYVVRPFSIYITKILLYTPITANQVSLIGMIFGICGAFAIGYGTFQSGIVGVMLLQFGYLLDCIDGEIARYYKQSSVNGIFIDFLGHRIVIPLIFLGAAFMIYMNSQNIYMLIIGILGAEASSSPLNTVKRNVIMSLSIHSNLDHYNFQKLSRDSDTKEGLTPTPSTAERFLKAILFYPGNMNVISISVLGYYQFREIFTLFLLGYFILQILAQIGMAVSWYINNSVENEFIGLIKNISNAYLNRDVINSKGKK